MWAHFTTRTLSPHPADPGVWARALSVPLPWNALSQLLGRPCTSPWAHLSLSGADLGVGPDGRKDGGLPGGQPVGHWQSLSQRRTGSEPQF